MPMEDVFVRIFFLMLTLAIPAILNRLKRFGIEEQEAEDRADEDFSPSSASIPAERNTQKEATQKIPVTTPPTSPHPLHAKANNAPQLTSQQPVQPKIDRILRRYSGWKKALIIHEIMRPCNSIE